MSDRPLTVDERRCFAAVAGTTDADPFTVTRAEVAARFAAAAHRPGPAHGEKHVVAAQKEP